MTFETVSAAMLKIHGFWNLDSLTLKVKALIFYASRFTQQCNITSQSSKIDFVFHLCNNEHAETKPTEINNYCEIIHPADTTYHCHSCHTHM
jgi:hypothetical protein